MYPFQKIRSCFEDGSVWIPRIYFFHPTDINQLILQYRYKIYSWNLKSNQKRLIFENKEGDTTCDVITQSGYLMIFQVAQSTFRQHYNLDNNRLYIYRAKGLKKILTVKKFDLEHPEFIKSGFLDAKFRIFFQEEIGRFSVKLKEENLLRIDLLRRRIKANIFTPDDVKAISEVMPTYLASQEFFGVISRIERALAF